MLTLVAHRGNHSSDGASRRDVLRVGSLGLAGLTLPNLLRARAQAAQAGRTVHNKSVIWIWLAGGPTHVETFDPKMTAPVEYRSITGEVKTPLAGVTIGGSFPQIASHLDKMTLIRSFAHGNSSHGSATTWVMTGYNDRTGTKPSLGSIVARAQGTTNLATGMPTYIRFGGIGSDGPGWLGPRYSPFDSGGQARKNMAISVPAERFADRRSLLSSVDRIRREVDSTGKMDGMDGFEQQAFDLVLGDSQDAFDINREAAPLRERYGKGLGENLLKARRLAEAGCGFITVSYGGWDMHGGIEKGLKTRGPEVDRSVSALLEDLHARNMLDDTLVVVTGEFGRTPRINNNAGRDHWGRLCTLALAGGGLRMGQVIGESSDRAEMPATTPVTPQDVMATVLHMYGLDYRLQFDSNQGRPTYMIEDGHPIAELI
jgi:hypothetical protein